MLTALIITSLLLLGNIALSIWLGFQVHQTKAERDKYLRKYRVYRQQMRPAIIYLTRQHNKGREITDDGLRTSFATLQVDYEQWIDDVSQ